MLLCGKGRCSRLRTGTFAKRTPTRSRQSSAIGGAKIVDLPWLIGATLANPQRLAMTNPYRVDVGYVFDVNGRQLALFGEADYIWANELSDEENEGFRLEVGAPYSAA
jgi:hypothetical protein